MNSPFLKRQIYFDLKGNIDIKLFNLKIKRFFFTSINIIIINGSLVTVLFLHITIKQLYIHTIFRDGVISTL